MWEALARVERAMQGAGIGSPEETAVIASDLLLVRELRGAKHPDFERMHGWFRAQVEARSEAGLTERLFREAERLAGEPGAWTLARIRDLTSVYARACDLEALGFAAPHASLAAASLAVSEQIRRFEHRSLDERGATEVAYAAFHAQHPAASLPRWFQEVLYTRAARSESHWEVGFLLPRYVPLEPGHSMVDYRGHRMLAHTDPVSGEREFVISYQPKRQEERELFRCRVHSVTAEASVECDFDLAALEPVQHWIPWWEGPASP